MQLIRVAVIHVNKVTIEKKTIAAVKALLSFGTPSTLIGQTSIVIALKTLHPIAPIPLPNITAAIYLNFSAPANAKVELCAMPLIKPKGTNKQKMSQKLLAKHKIGKIISIVPMAKYMPEIRN